MKTSIHSYLAFAGNCEVAFNFYKSVFGGDFAYVGRFKDMPSEEPIPEDVQEKIMHISLPIGDCTVLMGSDSIDESCGGPLIEGNNISLSINTNTEDEAKRIFTALSKGGKVTMPLEKTFWGALFGTFTDAFGINWMVNYDYEQK